MITEYSCLKCNQPVEFDNTEKMWGCDCFATREIFDDGGSGLEYIPGYWRENPTVVCLCGSTKFVDEYDRQMLRLTLEGKIVLTIGTHRNSDENLARKYADGFENKKPMLDWLHLRKIDLADEILVLNVRGYIGNSTRREIEYAKSRGVIIRWLEGETG